jgi:uncharacterized protein
LLHQGFRGFATRSLFSYSEAKKGEIIIPAFYQIIRKEEQQTSTWSGGTTTQIAIFPADSDYISRNFDWRMSSATVDEERSVFTRLPGIERIVMIIHGEMVLEHVGHHRTLLRPFEQDTFSGEWITHGNGHATDFNLMLSAQCSGRLQVLGFQAPNQQFYQENISKAGDSCEAWETLYCVDGTLSVQFYDANVGKETFIQENLNPGDFLIIHRHQLISDLTLSVIYDGKQDDEVRHVIRGTVSRKVG